MINPNISFDEVLENLIDRDENDASRAVAPMKKAVDALLLDTTELSIDAAVAIVIGDVKEQIALCELES
jgi:cytidylate kinase